MEFQYRSINKDRGFSIIEQLTKQGVKWENYLHFYNLRNYDRINTQTSDKEKYEQASNAMAQQQGQYGQGAYPPYQGPSGNYQSVKTETWNSVAKCCMLNGPDLRTIPWSGTPEEELAAFVSEELYIHTKLLIADDKKVICGSANINDRSQLGDHDSEIAVLIEDPTPLQTTMAGRPFTASNFAATLRRQIFRKHLGLIPAQNLARTDENCFPFPAPNLYDFGSAADYLVSDPLSPRFWETWTATANYNTYAFRTVFHAVPDDTVRNWKQYEEFYSKHFREEEKDKNGIVTKAAGKEKVCHVVRDQGEGRPPLDARAVKEILYQVKGHLVHMPLHFLEEEDIAQEGVGLNAFTETIYT
jgi:phospholipase D1/2